MMDLPAEVLLAIFKNFRPPLDFSATSPYEGNDGADVETIKSIRLTCRRFCQHSSHLLIGRLRVSPTMASLDRLESVSSRPELWRGERILDIDLRNYSALNAGDFHEFATMLSRDLQMSIWALNDSIKSLREQNGKKSNKKSNKKSTGRPIFLPKGVSMLSAEQGVLQLERVSSKWQPFRNQVHASVEESAQHDAAILALQRGYERYQQLYQEQQRLIQNGSFASAIAAAAAASGSKIWLYMSDMRSGEHSTHRLKTELQELAKSNFLSFTDPHDFDHALSYIARPHSWWVMGREHSGELPHSLLYEIPLAMRTVETQLAKLEVRMNYPAHWLDLSMSDEQFSRFEEVTKDLEAFIFSPIQQHEDPLARSEDLQSLYYYLRAAMGRQIVPNLYLDLCAGKDIEDDIRPYDVRPPLDPLVRSSNWQGLKSAVLVSFDVGIEGLRTLIDMLEPGTKLGLEEPLLESGTWADALDCLRSKVSQDSWLINPTGAETVRMRAKEYKKIFICEGGSIEGSKATQYIRSVEGVENPLLVRNTG